MEIITTPQDQPVSPLRWEEIHPKPHHKATTQSVLSSAQGEHRYRSDKGAQGDPVKEVEGHPQSRSGRTDRQTEHRQTDRQTDRQTSGTGHSAPSSLPFNLA